MKRTIVMSAAAIAIACASLDASAHADISVFFGFPGPVYEAPPAVVYEPPPVVYAPAPAVYGYPYDDGYWGRRHWYGNGWHRGWRHHDRDDDDED